MDDVKILPGDVLFVWDDSFVDETIEKISHGACHVALFISPNTVAEAQAGRVIGEQSLDYYMQNSTRLEILTDPTLTDEDRVEIVKYAKTLYGLHYDLLLIPIEFFHFELGMKLDWYHERKHLICSTYTYDCGKSRGKIWAKNSNPAPVDEYDGGKLQKKLVLK